MATGSKQQKTFLDFSGGVNYAVDMTSLGENEVPNAMNIEFWPDRVAKRKGYEALTTAVSTTDKKGYSIVDFGVVSVGHKQVAHIGTKVYAMNVVDGALTELRAAAPSKRSYNAKVKSSLIQTYEDYSAPYYWDGLAASMAIVSASAPGFKRVVEFQGYLLGMSTDTYRMRIYYEDVATMIGGTFANYFTLTPAPNDDEISEPFLLNGRCYVGSKYSIFRVSFVGGVTVFDYKQVITGVGIVPNTLQVVISKEFGQVAIFMGSDRQIYVFDGTNIKVISDKYLDPNHDTEICMKYVNEQYKSNAYSVYDPIRQTYRLTVTRNGAQTNAYMININVQTFAYYPYDNMVFHSMALCYDQIERQYLLGLGYDGRVYKVFTNSADDAGTAIIEVFDFPILTYREHTVTKAGALTMLFKPLGKVDLQLYSRVDFKTRWTKQQAALPMYKSRDRFLGLNGALGSTAVLGSDAMVVDNGVSINSIFNQIQFRLTTDGERGTVCSYTAGTVTGSSGGTSLTGTGTVWTSDMTAANGWKIWIQSGIHKNEIYDFTYVSGTTATVSTLAAANITDAAYVVYRSGVAACALGWELLKVNLDGTLTMSGHTEVER